MAGQFAGQVIATSLIFLAALLSWIIFLRADVAEPTVVLMRWIDSGSFGAEWAIRLDRMTAIMLVVVNTVSALVHLYSWGYMDEDPDQPRFFAYLSLFTFAMLMLVTADNLVQLFFGWEGVGLASYLLIGFWYQKPSANAAAIKAFVVNRVGDFGFALGIFAIFMLVGSTDFETGEQRGDRVDHAIQAEPFEQADEIFVSGNYSKVMELQLPRGDMYPKQYPQPLLSSTTGELQVGSIL